MEPGSTVLFNIRPWNESPKSGRHSWLREYLVAQRGNNLAAGAITRAVHLGGGRQLTEWVTATLHRPGVDSLQRPIGGPGERAGGTVCMTARRAFIDARAVDMQRTPQGQRGRRAWHCRVRDP